MEFIIVGCGSIGKRHLAVLDSEEEAEIVAICDSVEERVKELSNLYNGIKAFTSYSKNVGRDRADVINVVTPHHLNASMTVEALNKGLMFWLKNL
ncbi:MAG: Gfo/Idh/MocA family oxidoreductase [Sphingobacteriaceae bacterium]|nr:Gfo/Idh/MocA family oxidoreductase [Sphingobacteriaceae bacterium]